MGQNLSVFSAILVLVCAILVLFPAIISSLIIWSMKFHGRKQQEMVTRKERKKHHRLCTRMKFGGLVWKESTLSGCSGLEFLPLLCFWCFSYSLLLRMEEAFSSFTLSEFSFPFEFPYVKIWMLLKWVLYG